MKRLIAILLLTVAAVGATVRFGWDDPDNPVGSVRGYAFYDVNEGTTNRLGEVVGLTFTGSFTNGLHTVYVTAVSTNGIESDPSNAVEFWVPRGPKNIAVVIAR